MPVKADSLTAQSDQSPQHFSLVILQFIDAVNLRDFIELNLWYLDDGTLVGKQSSHHLFLPLEVLSVDYI